jgi:hypothetical protein
MPTALKPLAATLVTALETGNAAELATAVLATNHRGKLLRLFGLFAHRFLEAHAQSKAHPHSRTMAKRAQRAKALLDLIRKRIAMLGVERPNDAALIQMAIDTDLPRLVHSRKAA